MSGLTPEVMCPQLNAVRVRYVTPSNILDRMSKSNSSQPEKVASQKALLSAERIIDAEGCEEVGQIADAALAAVSLRQQQLADSAANVQVSRPLRICISGYRSAPFGGGQGIYIKYLSKALVDAGHKVDVISGQPYPDVDPRVRLIKMPGLDLFANGLTSLRPRHLGSLTNIIEWTSKLTGGFAEPYCFSRRLYKYLLQHRDDYDIVHDNQCLGWGMLKLQQQGFHLLTTIHHPITSDLKIALNASNKWWERILIRRWHAFLVMQKQVASQLDHVVTVSQRSNKDIAEAFALEEKNIHLVYNGIDTEVFHPLPDVEPKPWQIMATASADQPLKGLRYLLIALSQLVKKYPQLNLLLVSKPQAGGETESLIKRLNLAKHIQCVHGISTEDLVAHYAQSSVAVVPSVYEGFGLPAGEAMACGVPVVSTNGGALPEVVGDAGVLVEVKNAEAIAQAIESLLLNKNLRRDYAERGRKRIEEKFSWALAAKEMTALYYLILDEPIVDGQSELGPALAKKAVAQESLPIGVANANS